ncbi:GNAT family N-acetyltransferase [Pseudahrensia aquimaris]|uniref:GNAT family N-acetyltransferase n=1 Tax=Pseudahrensia aquimaris TaxID=744461 RepID=A0ABW3FGB2_9HYPH
MDIKLEESGSGGRYFITTDNGDVAEMTFSKAGDSMIIIDHTSVPDSLRGGGYGQALVARAVEDMRAAGKKILPLCPFAATQFRRHPEHADVLNK